MTESRRGIPCFSDLLNFRLATFSVLLLLLWLLLPPGTWTSNTVSFCFMARGRTDQSDWVWALHLIYSFLPAFPNPGPVPQLWDQHLSWPWRFGWKLDACGCCLQIVTVILLSFSGKRPQVPEGSATSSLWGKFFSILLLPLLRTLSNSGQKWSFQHGWAHSIATAAPRGNSKRYAPQINLLTCWVCLSPTISLHISHLQHKLPSLCFENSQYFQCKRSIGKGQWLI